MLFFGCINKIYHKSQANAGNEYKPYMNRMEKFSA